MAKKKKTAYDDLRESLGLGNYSEKQIAQINNNSARQNFKGTAISPIKTNTQTTAQKILSGNNQIAPIAVDRQDILNKLKAQNEEKLKKQQEEQKIKELQSKIEEEKKKKGILTQEEINKKGKDNLLKNQFYTALDNKNKKTNAEEFNDLLKDNAKKQKEYIENSKEYKELSKLEASKTKVSKENTKNVIRKLADNYLSFDPVYGEAYNVIKRINKKGKEGQKATPSDFILGGNALSATADSIRTSNEKTLNSVEDNETTLLLKQEQERLRKELIANRKNSKKYTKILKDYNKISDALETEQASLLESKNGIGKIFDSFSSGFDSSVSGLDATVDKILGTKSEKRRGATQILSDKAMQETDSKIGKTALELTNSIGAMVPTMIAGLASGGASLAVSFGTYGGAAYNKAKQDDYTEEQATTYGIVNGTLEAALNKILPSFKIGGKNVYGKVATDKLTSKIMAKTIGNEALKRLITDAGGEFTEEYLQEFLDPIVREAILEENNGVGIIKGKDVADIASNIAKYTAKNFFSKENLHAGLLGALSSGLMGAPSAVRSNAYTKATGRSAETGLTQNEQKVVDSIVENRKAELKEKNGKVTKKDVSKIEQEVRQDLERGYIERNDIERALSNEEWTKHDNLVKQKEKLENQIKELENKTPQDYKTMGELNSSNEELSRLKEQLKTIDTDTTRNELNSAMNGKITDNDTLLQRTYGEEIEKNNAYQFDKNEKLTEQTKKINEDIEKLGLNNNIKTRDIVDLIKKLSNETGRQYRLIDNNSTEMEKVEGKNVDGFVKNGEVFINVDSENLINRILGHETTHLFEGTEDYTKLQNAAIEYAKTKGEYDSRKSTLEEVYKDIKGANIENELTSDLVGDYLFSDIEFVRNLSTEQPNIFKKMYNYVKHLYNMATAGSKEARQLEQLKYNFEKVYRENNQSKASNNTKLMASKVEKNMDSEYNKDETRPFRYATEKNNPYGHTIDFVKMNRQQQHEAHRVISPLAAKYAGVEETYSVRDINGNMFDFDVFEDGNYRVSEVELIKDSVKEVVDETETNRNIQYSLGDSKQQQRYNNVNIESDRNIRTSRQNVKISEREQINSKNRVSNQTQERNNTQELDNSSFSLLTNKTETNLGTYQDGLSKTDKSYRYNKVISYDIKNGGKGDNVQVSVTKNGYVANNAMLSDNIKGKGEGTKIMLDLNQQSLEETGYPLRSLPEYSVVGIKNHTAEGKGLWDSLVRKGYAVKNANNSYTMLETAPTVQEYLNNKELDNSSFSNEKKYRGSHQIENAKAITELSINDIENRVKEVDGYLTKQSESDLRKLKKILNNSNEKVKIYRASPVNELNSGDWVTTDKSYAQNVANNNGGKVYTYEVDAKQLYYPDNVKDLPSLHRLSSFQYVEETSKPTMYSLSVKEAKTGTANNGVKLSKEQQEYFKDSKATDENGNLITVYHTMTNKGDQFNEFNPVGTDYYKFGDQVVNYYTNSKNMSGSYADQEYVMADTKKITSMEEARSLVKQMNIGLTSENTIRIETKDKGYQLVNNLYKEAYEHAKSIWDNEITPEEKQIEKDYEELYKRYVESGYDNNLVPEFTSLENYAKDYAQKLDKITDNMTPEERNIFTEIRRGNDGNFPDYIRTEPVIIGEYNSENELFRNLKQDIQKADSIKNKLQYEGYVNITNPYIIDAEGRTWNKVESKADSDITKELLKVNNEDRQYFERLASDSIHTYNENLFNYQQAERAINDFAVDRNNTTLEQRLIHRTIHDLGFEDFMKVLNNDKNVYWGRKEQFMDDAYNNGFATYKQKQDYQRTGNIPTEVLDKVNKLIHEPAKYEDRYLRKELEAMEMTPEIKETTIYDLWNNQDKAYKTFDEGGRYEYSKFNNEVNEKNLYRAIDNEILFKVAKKGFNDNNIRLLYNDWSVTNDIVKSIIELNKVGENYDGVIIKNVVDYGGYSDTHEPNDLYITFNSNQFKAVDNKTPTDDPDIRYRLSNKNDIAPITDNRNIRARDMLLPRQQEIQKAIAPIQEENKVLKQEVKALQKEVRDIKENSAVTQEEFEQENRRIAPLLEEQEAPPEIEQVYDNLKDTTRMPKKELKMLSKNIKDTLGLTNRQKLDLEEIIQDYSTSETATREDLYNDIKKRYGKQAIITEYEDIRNVQRKIKSMKLDVSDNIRHDIADYNMLRQKNFGKLSFSRNGQPVDSVYQELSSEYPNYFPSSIYNETDQFLRMVEVANLENKSIEEYNIDDDYIRETSDYIYDSIMDSKQDALQKAIEKTTKESLQGDLKAPLPTVFDTSSIEADNAYDEVRLMEHKARKKQKVNKTSNASRDSGLAPYIEFAREHNLTGNDEVIETLNEADAAEKNKRIEAQKKIKPQSENSIRKALTYGQYLFTNRNVEIDNYAEETGNHNIKVLADHINNIQGEISTNINDAQTDNFGKTIGKSITQIFSQADKAGLSEPFNDYLFHLSNIERHKWGKGSQVPMVDSLVLTEKYEKAYPEMKSWAKEVNKYNKNLLYKQADAGLITKELADNLSDRYEFYVPFMENLEGEYTPDSSNTIKTRSTVKRAKGGADRNLLGFEEAMINQTSSAISQIRKNQLYQEIAKTVDNATIDFDTNTNPDINNSGLMSDGKKYYLTAYVDGKATQVEIDKSLYHGLAQEGNRRIRNAEQKLAPLTNPLQKASNIRRNILTTWSPSFLATNMLKDIQDAPLNSKYASDMIKNYPKALKEIATGKGEHVEAFLNMYGQGNLRGDYNLDSGLADATELVKSSSKNKGIEISKSVLKKIPQMNEVIELAPRYAEYLASLENGCSQMEALYNAREVTTNFGRGGIITKALNRNGFTFLNANVQGMSRLVRNFSGANGARGVVNSLTKVAALGIAPALFNALMYGSGDDEDKDYKALPDYIKDNYYLIKTSNNNFIRIPKGRMLSIFGSAARRTLELSQGEKDAFNGYISNAYNQVGVQNPIESNIFAPLIQAKNNKTWYGSDLVPSRLQDKPKDEQYDSSTDKFSIWLGQKTKISPYKINYVIDQYSGGIGDMILPTITEEAQSDTNSTLGTMIAPLKDKFTADSTTDNKYVSDFYTKNDEFKVKANSSKATDKDKLTNQYMKTISFEMGQLYGEMRKVQEDKKLSKSEKYRKAQNIKKEINKLAEEGLNGYNKVSKVGDYAEVGEREFYKWTNDEGETVWSKPKDEDLDKLNSLGLTIGEKSEYYKTRSKLFDVWDKYKDNYDKSKSEAIKAIRKSNMSDDAKYALYNASYNKDEEMNIAQEVGIEADAFLDYMAQTFKADKNRYGKSISGSKKAKILNYINSMNIEPEQRMILYKMQYKTNNYYNNAIVNYLNNSSLTYEEEEYILKKLGFKVSKNGNISW
jgi:hypothetical protein